jgi:hypothetical protein
MEEMECRGRYLKAKVQVEEGGRRDDGGVNGRRCDYLSLYLTLVP